MQNFKSILSLNKEKKGQTLDLVIGTLVGLFVFILIGVIILFGIGSLNVGSFFPANSAEGNATTAAVQNLTAGFQSFSARIPTIFVILGVVTIMSALVILILLVLRVKNQVTAGQGTL